MDLKHYFGDYKDNNIYQVNKYMNELDNELKQYYNFGNPFFKGEDNLIFFEILKEKELNYESLNSKEVFKYIAPYFQNIPNWNNPGTMINIIPPVNLISLAALNIANAYNPNLAQDTYSGLLISSELEVSKYLSTLIGWDWKSSYGTFTFGGKGTNLYATKVALNKADKNVKKYGCNLNKYFIVTSKNGHPCHYEVCDWLGIGTDSCYEIDCNNNGEMDLNKAKEIIEKNILDGKIFLGFNLVVGSTNELFIDPIKEVYNLNLEIVKKFNLNYIPHIHADAVIGWIYLFFNEYNFKKNTLHINEKVLNKIKNLNKKVKELKYVDSIGVDFHKTGFCPYVSSIILFKNIEDYFSLGSKEGILLEELKYGNHNPYHTTLELTRSCSGPLAALCSLKSLGIEGFQKIIGTIFSSTEYFRTKLKDIKNVILINPETDGLASFFIIKPKNYNNLDLEKLSKLKQEDLAVIREYNINYGKYIVEQSRKGNISFTYTSSRSYVLFGTNIKIGAIKAYPMSVFLTEGEVDRIILEIKKTIDDYSNIDVEKYRDKNEISDDMVYRNK